jgi:hypothetical protein
VGRYKANFADRADQIELLRGGSYRHAIDYQSAHEEHTGEWSIELFESQTEVTLRNFKFNWPPKLRTLPAGGIGTLRQFPPVADWTTPVRVDRNGVPMLLIAGDDRYYYRKER